MGKLNLTPMAVEKRTFHIGGQRIEVGIQVKGTHTYQFLDPDSMRPPMTDLLFFPYSDTALPVNVYAGYRGTISFFVKLHYEFYPAFGGGAMQTLKAVASYGGPPASFGNKTYRFSFDYSLPVAATSPTDLTIQPQTVGVMVDNPEVFGDDDYTLEINTWNQDAGMAKGPNYVRIKPAIAFPQPSSGSSSGFQAGGDKGFGGGMQSSIQITPPLPGNAIGEFTIPIHTQFVPAQASDNKPPAAFVQDMAVGWLYEKDNDKVLTTAMKTALTNWMANINKKYPLGVAKALHKGDLAVSVGGYASIPGTAPYNQELSQWRADPVLDYLSRYLGAPKVSAVPYGSQFAYPYWEFGVNGSARIVSRPEDRKVIVSIDPDDAWKSALAP